MKRVVLLALLLTLALSAPAGAMPAVELSANPPNPLVGQRVDFTATVTPDESPTEPGVFEPILSYSWSFGDGSPGWATFGPTTSYVYGSAGSRIVTVIATDVTDSGTGQATVNVSNPPPPPNQAPVAAFSRTPLEPIAGQQVLFQSFSYDRDGPAPALTWIVDGVPAGSAATLTRTFNAGAHTVTLQASDGIDAHQTTQTFTVAPPPPNPLPVARFRVVPTSPVAGDPVTLISSSFDPQGEAISEAWDTDNDGAFDDGTGDFTTVSLDAGARTVRLRVTDAAGGTQFATRTITVRPRPPAGPSQGPTLMTPFPVVRISGDIRPRGARLRLFTVRAPRGARIVVRCGGKRCPFKTIRRSGSRRVVRFQRAQRFLPAGTVLTVRVTARDKIGKLTRFVVRAGKAPKRVDRCLRPGAKKATRCP